MKSKEELMAMYHDKRQRAAEDAIIGTRPIQDIAAGKKKVR